jgi:hypothetical protein
VTRIEKGFGSWRRGITAAARGSDGTGLPKREKPGLVGLLYRPFS